MIGERLKNLRLENGLKQEELATIIGVKKSAVSNYENDKDSPSDKVKIAIAKHFNVSTDYFLGLVNDPIPYYNEDSFIWIPQGVKSDEKHLLTEFLSYLAHRRVQSSDGDCEFALEAM